MVAIELKYLYCKSGMALYIIAQENHGALHLPFNTCMPFLKKCAIKDNPVVTHSKFPNSFQSCNFNCYSCSYQLKIAQETVVSNHVTSKWRMCASPHPETNALMLFSIKDRQNKAMA